MIYLIIFCGWLLGELMAIVAQAIFVQKSDKYKANFGQAVRVYVTKDVGPLIGSFLLILIAMFLLPELIANMSTLDASTEKEEERKHNAVLSKVLKWLRTSSVLLGIVSRALFFIILSRANKWIKRLGGGEDTVVGPDQTK